MKKVIQRRTYYIYLLVVVALLSIPLVTSACSQNTVNIGQEFSLNIGQATDLEEDDLRIKFLEVIQDSRCAIGTTCIWAGEVTFVVEITYEGSTEQITLTQPGLNDWPSKYLYKQLYEITYNVKPYPELDKQISEDDYRLELIINPVNQGSTLGDTKWFLRSYGEQNNMKAVIEGTEITATFSSDQSKVNGSAGCNTYSAGYEVKGDELSVFEMVFTEMACISPEGVMEQEQDFLSLLANAQSFEADDTTLTIICEGGQQLYFTTAAR